MMWQATSKARGKYHCHVRTPQILSLTITSLSLFSKRSSFLSLSLLPPSTSTSLSFSYLSDQKQNRKKKKKRKEFYFSHFTSQYFRAKNISRFFVLQISASREVPVGTCNYFLFFVFFFLCILEKKNYASYLNTFERSFSDYSCCNLFCLKK